MRIVVLIYLLFLSLGSCVGQSVSQDSVPKRDSTLGNFLRNGKFYGHGRYFFMATNNTVGLDDYFANAFGFGIGYETPRFKFLSVGVSGYFIANLGSSDLKSNDLLSGLPNRYEIGLFDIENPNNYTNLSRLENLYLRVGNNNSFLKIGKQHFNSPFVNPQDGRMSPTFVDGIYSEWNSWKNWKFQNSLIWGILPRSTFRWYSVGNSMGIYPVGFNPDGSKSAYAGNIQSDWILVNGVEHHLQKSVNIQIWNQLVQNVFNTSLIQIDYNPILYRKREISLVLGAQFINQNAIRSGGNSDQNKTFIPRNSQAQTYSFRIGIEKKKKWSGLINFTHIGTKGRYLMPREWGVDPFYTFMPRERNEGLSDVNAINIRFVSNVWSNKLRLGISLGRFFLPDVKNAQANKYAMPSYDHVNLDIQYQPGGYFRDFNLQFLVVHKSSLGETYGNMRYVHNKVDMTLFNVVLNFHF
jgi:hypothetical protein